MTQEGAAIARDASAEPVPEPRKRTRRQFKALIAGGVVLIVTGIALAAYMAAYEDEPFLIALGPAFIGVMIIIAAVFGKRP